MESVVPIATVMFFVQIIHSLEELTTDFHKKWFLFKMPFWIFLTFEIIHTTFWAIVLLIQNFPFREQFLLFFIILMFANGLEHVIWAIKVKKYVPGLVTAPIHILLFVTFIYSMVR